MHKFTMGSDPEFMIKDNQGNLRSAIALVHGTSTNRIEVGGHSFYHDNVNVEMAIAPGTSKSQVLNNFRDAFCICAEMLAPFLMVPQASADYPLQELEDPAAKEIACNAEYCAYALRELPKPVAEFQAGTFRSAGGHIHLGADLETNSSLRDPFNFFFVIRTLDLFLGIPALFMDHDPTSRRRKELYGLAGSHRWKPYGVEYRALGNFWLASPKLVETVYDICEFTIDFVNRGKHLQFWRIDQKMIDHGEEIADSIFPTGIEQEELRTCLNTADKTKGKRFLSLVESHLPRGLFVDIQTRTEPTHYDFYREWSL